MILSASSFACCVLRAIICVFGLQVLAARAQEAPAPPQKPPSTESADDADGGTPEVIGFEQSGSLAPLRPSAKWHDGMTLKLGGAYEALSDRTARRFQAPNLGLFWGMTQHIRGPWSGGLSIWLSRWVVRQENTAFVSRYKEGFFETAPVRIFSHVELDVSFALRKWMLKEASIWNYFRPSAYAGLGFLTFLEKRGWPLARGEELDGEAIAQWGVGVRGIVPDVFALHLSVEKWRGVKTFNFTGSAVTLSLEFGDVGYKN